jgi:hypothetical protein
MTNRAAVTQSPSNRPSLAARPEPAKPSGDLVATVPEVAFGPTDAAAVTLMRGRSNALTVTVWVAPGSGPAVITVASSGARLTGCPPTTVGSGVTRLHCTMTPAVAAPTDLGVGVSAALADGSSVTRRYAHKLV